jgi:ABC-type nitrate/sulfonate/bicarbonate transport system substrate-binding protein
MMKKRTQLNGGRALCIFSLVQRALVAAAAMLLLFSAADTLAADKLTVGDAYGSPLSHVHAIAAAKGYSEPGLEIEWMRFPTGAALVEGIAAGKIQVGIAGDTPAMALISGGTPAKIVAKQTDSSLAYALYARQDANIKRPEDIYGKTVGLTFGSQAQSLWLSILAAQNLDPGKMKTINLPPSGLQAAYQRGEIDAYVLWQPGAYVISQLRPTVKLEDPAASYFPAAAGPKKLFGYYTVVAARDEVIRDHPELLKAFLRLVDKTNKFISANPGESADIIAKELKIERAAPEIVLQQTKHEMTVDETFVKDMEAQANLLFKQGRFKDKPPAGLKGWVDFSILKQTFPEYVKSPL